MKRIFLLINIYIKKRDDATRFADQIFVDPW